MRPRAGHLRRVGAGGCEEEAAARSAAGNLWARPRAGWEKTAQLRPGPRAHGGGNRSLFFLLPHCSRRLDLRALSMPRAGARLTANTPGLRGVRGRSDYSPQILARGEWEGQSRRPYSPREFGWDGVWERGQTGWETKGLESETSRRQTLGPKLLGSRVISEPPVTCLALYWAANFHSFLSLELTEHLLCSSPSAGF